MTQIWARTDLLRKFVQRHPMWGPAVETFIWRNYYIVLPASYAARKKVFLDFPHDDDCLVIFKPGIKGSPEIYRIDGAIIKCTNYRAYIGATPGFIEYVAQIMRQGFPEEFLTQMIEILS